MQDWRPWRDPRPHAWGNKYTLTLFVVGVVALFLVYRQMSPETPEQLTIGTSVSADARLSDAPRPVSDSVNRRALSNLSDFRARHRSLEIDIRVRSTVDAPAALAVVETLERWLTTLQLRAGSRSESVLPLSPGTLQLIHAPRQDRYAEEFARSLSPYLNATVERVSDPTLSPGQLRLFIHQSPEFDEEGRVYFQ